LRQRKIGVRRFPPTWVLVLLWCLALGAWCLRPRLSVPSVCSCGKIVKIGAFADSRRFRPRRTRYLRKTKSSNADFLALDPRRSTLDSFGIALASRPPLRILIGFNDHYG
jgi:hypothetical protein